MNVDALRIHIRATLQLISLWSHEAEELLLGTCAQESHLGTYRRQIGGGPGTGIYQIERATEHSLWADYIDYRPSLAVGIATLTGVKKPDLYQLEMNLAYQHIMCRLRYWAWVKEPIPQWLNGQAQYWKKHYNTEGGGRDSRRVYLQLPPIRYPIIY